MTRSSAQKSAPAVFGCTLQLPALKDEHVDQAGFYVAATVRDYNKPWRGYALYEGTSLSSSHVRREVYTDRATFGLCTAFTGISVDHRMIDYANTITVELMHPNDTLESVTEQEMLLGRNRFVMGREVFGAATATLISINEFSGCRTYELSVLNRGLLGTFDDTEMFHTPGELLVHLDDAGVYFYPYAPSKVGETGYFKFVAIGGTVVEGSNQTVRYAGSTLKPFTPVCLAGTRNGGNDLTVTWERQSRRSVQALDQRVPYDAEVERYKISVVTGPEDTAVALRSTIVSGTRTWTYTASNQTIDGITPGDPVTIVISQMGSILQDGKETIVTL